MLYRGYDDGDTQAVTVHRSMIKIKKGIPVAGNTQRHEYR